MTLYRISGWETLFETSLTQKRRRNGQVSFPVNLGTLRYKLLMEHGNGPAIYAVYIALIEHQYTLVPPRYGYITQNGRRDGDVVEPHTIIGMGKSLVTDALGVLSGPNIGWLDVIKPAGASDEPKAVPKSKNKRISKLDQFCLNVVNDDLVIQAIHDAYPDLNISEEIKKFKTHWMLNPKGAPKSDYKRALNNWMKIAIKFQRRNEYGSGFAGGGTGRTGLDALEEREGKG